MAKTGFSILDLLLPENLFFGAEEEAADKPELFQPRDTIERELIRSAQASDLQDQDVIDGELAIPAAGAGAIAIGTGKNNLPARTGELIKAPNVSPLQRSRGDVARRVLIPEVEGEALKKAAKVADIEDIAFSSVRRKAAPAAKQITQGAKFPVANVADDVAEAVSKSIPNKTGIGKKILGTAGKLGKYWFGATLAVAAMYAAISYINGKKDAEISEPEIMKAIDEDEELARVVEYMREPTRRRELSQKGFDREMNTRIKKVQQAAIDEFVKASRGRNE